MPLIFDVLLLYLKPRFFIEFSRGCRSDGLAGLDATTEASEFPNAKARRL
jgi:hypothetical protein